MSRFRRPVQSEFVVILFLPVSGSSMDGNWRAKPAADDNEKAKTDYVDLVETN
jgi:hypothetical protein